MTDWKEYRLGDLISIKHGYAFPGSGITSVDNGIVLVTPGNFNIGGGFKEEKCKFFSDNYPNEYVLRSGDLIVTMTDLSREIDTLGYGAIVPSNPSRIYLHNQRIGLVNILEPSIINQSFLSFLLRTDKYQKWVAGCSSGTTVHHTSPSKIYEYKVEIPPLAEQKKIAAILSSLDEKIETNRKINARLEELAQALFKSWFIDFEPFGGQMPKDWETGMLSDIANIIMGQSPKGEYINSNQAGMIFYQGKTEFGDRFPSVKNYTSMATRVAPANSVLLSVRAPVGDVNITLNECCIGRGIASIEYKHGSNSFIYLLLKNKSDYFDIFDKGGTVFGSINRKGLEEMPIIIPQASVIKSFNEKLLPIDIEIERRYKESSRLAELRDALLPKLMSGELKPE